MSAFYRKLSGSLLILLLILLSGVKVLDDYVDDYTDNAIRNAAITYATARSLNAVVSVLQSSNVEADLLVVSGSLKIGEFLDPLNDMIERFSSVMTVVLVSLAAQKILLLIASHQMFMVLISATGFATIMAIYFGYLWQRSLISRCFLVLVVIRFSLAFAVGLNSGVDHFFLDQPARVNDRQVNAFQDDLLGIKDAAAGGATDLQASGINFWKMLNVETFKHKVSTGIRNFINLLAIYLLKTLVLPLLFLYLVLQVIRRLWQVPLVSKPQTADKNQGAP